MASGDTLGFFPASAGQPPAASYATPDQRNSIFVLDFDAAADESTVFLGVLPSNYAGGGLTIITDWMATSATSGSIRVQTQIERWNAADDHDADAFAAAQSAGATVSGTSGIDFPITTTHTSGAQMDSLAAGERFRLKVTRDADGTSGTDDAAGDGELVSVTIKET